MTRTPSRRSQNLAGLTAALVLVPVAIFTWWLFVSAPSPETQAVPTPAPLVDVVPIHHSSHAISVRGYGVVTAAREVAVTPQVEGNVIAISENLEPGGRMRAGDILYKIDSRDFDLAVTRAEALVAQAEVELLRERSEASLALRDLEDLFPERNIVDSSPLALREPQMRQAEAGLAAARASLSEAQLDRSRTTVRAPFDAVIIEEDIEIGGRVGPDISLLRLVGDEVFWIVATTPLADLPRLKGAEGRAVRVTLDPGSNSAFAREGRFVRALPSVDPEGRMGRILIEVEDPLGDATDVGPMTIGGYARVEINVGELDQVVRLPREALRENDVVWVRDGQGQLQFRDVEVRRFGPEHVLAHIDKTAGDELIVSYLDDPLPGLVVRVREDDGRV